MTFQPARTMKRILYAIASLLLVSGCGPDDSQQTDSGKLVVDKESLEFSAEGGEQTFTVTTSRTMYLLPGEGWISAEKGTKGKDNKTVVTVKVEPNEWPEVRTSAVTVVAGDVKKSVGITQAAGTGISGDAPVLGDNAAWKIAQKLGLGWNLGNHFDAYNDGVSGETAWGNPKATQATFTKLRAMGFKTVRIPVTWLGHIGEAPDYKIEAAWLNRVAEVVGYAESAGLNVVVNMHHDGADSKHWLDIKTAAKDSEVQEQIVAQVHAMWTQIAEKFRDKGDFLIFEAFNEIHDGGWGWGENRSDGGRQYACLKEWNQTFVDAVRAAGGNNATRILGIPAYCTNVDIALESFEMPDDTVKDKLMISVHCYDPYLYTLEAQYSEWGHNAAASRKAPGDNEAELRKVFEKVYSNYVSKGIPVYFGEFGCVNRGTEREQQFQQYYLKYFAKLAALNGVPSFIWDNGAHGGGRESHAFVNHGTGEFCSDEAKAAIQAMVGAYTDSRSLDDIYASSPAKE